MPLVRSMTPAPKADVPRPGCNSSNDPRSGSGSRPVIIGGVNPPRVVVGVPAPQVIAHRAVQGGGTAVGETMVVRRVKLTPATVNGHEVAAQTDHGGKIPQEIDITVSLADWRALTAFPATDSDVLVHDRYQPAKGDLNRLARFLDIPSIKYLEGWLVSATRAAGRSSCRYRRPIIARTFSSSAVVNDMILYIKMLDNYTFSYPATG